MNKIPEKERLFLVNLIEQMTGAQFSVTDSRLTSIRFALEKLMAAASCACLSEYLMRINSDSLELQKFISAITLHHTSWFRQSQQFAQLRRMVEARCESGPHPSIKVLCCGCSTGQEVYSVSLYLEKLREQFQFDYSIVGWDIDPLSVKKAASGLYPIQEMNTLPPEYRPWLMIGTGEWDAFFTIDPKIKEKCSFRVQNILEFSEEDLNEVFDIIFCRDVLVYFTFQKIDLVMRSLIQQLKKDGHIYLGNNEILPENFKQMQTLAPQVYVKKVLNQKRVLVVDDLSVTRLTLRKVLEKNGFEVLEAASAEEATSILSLQAVDLVSLDLHLPKENGAVWLQRQRNEGLKVPVIIVSASDPSEAEVVFGALAQGSQEYFTKELLFKDLRTYVNIVEALTHTKSEDHIQTKLKTASPGESPDLIVIGASTGGPDVLWRLLKNIPKPCPPIVVVQHTVPHFAAPFAQTLAKASGLVCGGDKEQELLAENHIYLAHGDYHLEVRNQNGSLLLQKSVEEKINGHRPSVDQLFFSVAASGVSTLAILLTGMGKDGAEGMKRIFENNGIFNMAQSERSCVVYGMPREAIALNAVHFVGDVGDMRSRLFQAIKLYQTKQGTLKASVA